MISTTPGALAVCTHHLQWWEGFYSQDEELPTQPACWQPDWFLPPSQGSQQLCCICSLWKHSYYVQYKTDIQIKHAEIALLIHLMEVFSHGIGNVCVFSLMNRFKFWSCLILYSRGLDLPVKKAFLACRTACCSRDILESQSRLWVYTQRRIHKTKLNR